MTIVLMGANPAVAASIVNDLNPGLMFAWVVSIVIVLPVILIYDL
jgi:hypothetical protein